MPLLRSHSHREAQRLAARALEKVGVPECAEQWWGSLADSEQALVAVAHALVREPRALLVDDQTTSLDDLQREEVMELLRSLAEQQNMGVLVTVPDMAEMVRAHRFRSLSSGRLLAPADSSVPEGGVGELIDLPKRRHQARA
jgi:ABC-type cobalamin/Fe3+-siderophores transport system ATPase subunit